jgi:hypothetical protein
VTHPLFDLLAELDASRVHYAISRHRAESVMVTATFVGERVEATVFEDGHMEVSRFAGDESVQGGADLVHQLIAQDRD